MQLSREEENRMIEKIIKFYSFGEDREAKRVLQRILAEERLTEEEISLQTFSELKERLEDVDNLIEKFNNLQISSDPFASATAIYHLPTLLTIKKTIVDRIRYIQSEEEIKNIVSEAQKGAFDDIEQKIGEIIEMNSNYLKKSIDTELEKQEAQAEYDTFSKEIARRREEREAFKEKWAIWQSLMARESVSTVIGALLLFIIAIAEIIAAFLHITTSQILDNGFLVLLGYFFGQTVSKISSDQKTNK